MNSYVVEELKIRKKNGKTECCTVTEFFNLKGLLAAIHTKIVILLKESSPSIKNVHRWILELKYGRRSGENELRSKPITETTPEITITYY